MEGTIVLVRTDWNVPVQEGKVLVASRIEAAAKTINFILDKGGKVIVISHLGDGADSLTPVVEEARKIFVDRNVVFARDPWNESSPEGKKAS
jgi:3-phosphoglycerate kinase